MEAKTETTKKITITLNEKEALILAEIVQNSMYQDPDDEPEEERLLRKEIFKACRN